MMDWNDSWGADWLAIAAVCALMLSGLVALAAVIWIAARSAGTASSIPPPDPLRLLDARFARGELSENDYLTARSLLDAHTPASEMQGSHRGST